MVSVIGVAFSKEKETEKTPTTEFELSGMSGICRECREKDDKIDCNHGAPSTRGHAPLLQVIDALGAFVRIESS